MVIRGTRFVYPLQQRANDQFPQRTASIVCQVLPLLLLPLIEK